MANSNYDKIREKLDADTKKVKSLKLSDYEKSAKKSIASEKKAEQKSINDGYNSAKKNTHAVYNKNLYDTNIAYESGYQKNAVQKLINEKKIAETNASLGLTDSGLNRTQQTAAQLSYANQKGALDIERQKAIDNLTLGLSAALSDIENNRNNDILASNQKWDNKARSIAQTNYNNDLAAYNNRIASAYEQLGEIDKLKIVADSQSNAGAKTGSKTDTKSQSNANTITQSNANVKPKNNTNAKPQNNVVSPQTNNSNRKYIIQTSGGLLSRDYYGTLKDNNVDVIDNGNGTFTYVDNNSGNKTTLMSGINPYTGRKNKDVNYGAFSNGYQPNNIDGVKLKKVDDVEISVKGCPQSVFYANGVYYVWDGENNEYHMLSRIQVYKLGLSS